MHFSITEEVVANLFNEKARKSLWPTFLKGQHILCILSLFSLTCYSEGYGESYAVIEQTMQYMYGKLLFIEIFKAHFNSVYSFIYVRK